MLCKHCNEKIKIEFQKCYISNGYCEKVELSVEERLDRLYEAMHLLIDETPLEAIDERLRDDIYTILEGEEDDNT
jgi:hypothetical protein